jgi:branched-subunit amino acid aminotransferase/4-amino-4-deoxychorismate lyase
MNVMWHNGRFVIEGAVFLPQDRIRLGDGVFDTMLAAAGKPVHSNEHFKRLLNHAAILRIKPDWSISDLKGAADELLRQNKCAASRHVVNTIITRGPAERGLGIPDSPPVQTVMVVSPAPAEFAPVHAVTAAGVRRNEGSPLSQIKSCNYGDNILAMTEAKERGGNEAILLNNRGNVACASASNIFVVQDGRLYTPPLADGTIDGIMRGSMIRRLGALEKSLMPADLQGSEGIFLTNSVRGVVPVVMLDGKKMAPPSLEIDKDFHLI